MINKKIFFIMIPMLLSSCIRDNNDDCGVYLEFIFDYNMEYADAFNPQVESVDVYIFDEEGMFFRHIEAKSTQLMDRKRMYLTDELEYNKTYQVITVGGQSEQIRVTGLQEENLKSATASIEQLKLALQRESGTINFQFPHVWFGETVIINYDLNRAVWPVRLVRNTNKFNLQLQEIDEEDIKQPEIPPYTFEIVTPEGGIYGYDNTPLVKENVSYHPFSLVMVNEPANTTVGRLNTMRLLADEGTDNYHLVIRRTDTGEPVWSCDLLDLLKNTKPPTRPDGTALPMQEYLDRQGEWNVEILYREIMEGQKDGFVAISISVNGWIIWLNDVGI